MSSIKITEQVKISGETVDKVFNNSLANKKSYTKVTNIYEYIFVHFREICFFFCLFFSKVN